MPPKRKPIMVDSTTQMEMDNISIKMDVTTQTETDSIIPTKIIRRVKITSSSHDKKTILNPLEFIVWIKKMTYICVDIRDVYGKEKWKCPYYKMNVNSTFDISVTTM
jgi:hypothetical protein